MCDIVNGEVSECYSALTDAYNDGESAFDETDELAELIAETWSARYYTCLVMFHLARDILRASAGSRAAAGVFALDVKSKSEKAKRLLSRIVNGYDTRTAERARELVRDIDSMTEQCSAMLNP